MLPHTTVAAVAFAPELAPPGTYARTSRQTVFTRALASARGRCLALLLDRLGLPAATHVRTGRSGEPRFPAGLVGSITTKGTVVLAVAGKPSACLATIGIDLEHVGPDAGLLERAIAPEGLPRLQPQSLRLLAAFAAKEAVYKAVFPLSRQPLDFPDVLLRWRRTSFAAITHFAETTCVAVSGSIAVRGMWVLAAAVGQPRKCSLFAHRRAIIL
ncbi:MAG: 4'-phosphopantetheinyl transferase superfamily protein [Planctomycetia bacterium]